ncbi:MAG: GntR family transcriptional regulator [Verrucomicrobia bacterium]|nr:GntR family transcriptional regulator [Verrucomicrobiota bacterium]MBV9273605.1 GntR family transcriptional regulator [Verrucomicrobiota bacterium]
MATRSSSHFTSTESPTDVIPFPTEDRTVKTRKAQTLHHGVLSTLRDLIVHGELLPGARLTEAVLCGRLKVSRTPLREALKVLSHEGLVEILPNRGARVVRLLLEDVRHLFEVIGALESLAGRLACERITDAEICEIRAIHYQMQASFIRRDLPEYFRLNQSIHRRIVAAAGNPVLTATHENLNARLLRARYLASQTDQERWAAAMHEHELIIDALGGRAAEEIGRLLQEHLWHKYDTIRAHFDRL